MKVLKKIIILTLIPIILELSGLFVIHKFYLGNKTSFNVKKVDISSKNSHTKINIKIPDDAEDIKVSRNGNYISYYKDDTIYVIDTNSNKEKKVSIENDSKIAYYTWDIESDVILIAEKFSREKSTYLKLEAYDAKRDFKTERKNDENEVLEILLPNSNCKIENIVFSGASNVTYIAAKTNEQINRIYRVNRMTEMNVVKLSKAILGNMVVINNQDGDQLIYEDRSTNRIRMGKSGQTIATGENSEHYLLGTDNNDQIYIGNGKDENINKIFVANLNEHKNNWKTYQLQEYANKKDVYILRDGRIYINNSSKKTVTEIATGKSIQYEGQLVGIYNYGVISKEGNKILGSLFK